MSKKKHTFLDVFSEQETQSRRSRRRTLSSERGAERASASSERRAERESAGARRSRRRGRQHEASQEAVGYELAETRVPGSSGVRAEGESLTATPLTATNDELRSQAGRSPVKASPGQDPAQGRDGGPAASTTARSGARPARSFPERAQRWLSTDATTSRGVLVGAAGVALLLLWGAFQLGSRVHAAAPQPDETGAHAGVAAGEGDAESTQPPMQKPGGRDQLRKDAGKTGIPGAELASKEPGAKEGGLKQEGSGSPLVLGPKGFLIMTLADTPETVKSSGEVVRYLVAQGIPRAQLDWTRDDEGKQILVGVRFPRGADAQQEQALFERIRAMPALRNQRARMDFSTIEKMLTYTVPEDEKR